MQLVFTQEWRNSFWIFVACSVLQASDEGDCLCHLKENVFAYVKSLQMYTNCLHYCCFALQSCCCLFTCLSPFFYTALLLLPVYFFIPKLLLNFCLFVDHVNKPIIFVFGTFVYHFNNNTSMLVTIYYLEVAVV